MATPVIDVYVFNNNGMEFGSRNDHYPLQSGFETFGESKEGHCGVIYATHNSQIQDEDMVVPNQYKAFSCDKITNIQEGVKDKRILPPVIKMYDGLYQLNPSDGYWNDLDAEHLIANINVVNDLMKSIKEDLLIPLIDDEDGYMISDFYAYGLIYNIECQQNTKIISIGDIHGSFHSLYRNIRRLISAGILDDNLRLLKDDYMIIFTGDIIGYGKFSLFVIHILCTLIYYNPYKVFCIRGNHEDYVEIKYDYINNIFTFDETYENSLYNREIKFIAEKSAELDTLIRHKVTSKSDNFVARFGELFTFSPSAIIVNYPNGKRIWFSHGGIPLEPLDRSVVIGKHGQIEDLNSKKINTFKNVYSIDRKSMATAVRFGDFAEDGIKIRSGQISISRDKVLPFIEDNNLSFIVRGHHDGEHTKLITTKGDPYDVAVNNITDHEPEAFICRTGNVNGPVMRIICDPKKWQKYYPVLTLTSAVGAVKMVKCDSFAIIRNDLTQEQIKLFDNSSIQVGGGMSFLIGGMLKMNREYKKYLKYKKKYLTLKSFL